MLQGARTGTGPDYYDMLTGFLCLTGLILRSVLTCHVRFLSMLLVCLNKGDLTLWQNSLLEMSLEISNDSGVAVCMQYDNDNENDLLPKLYREKHVINTIHMISSNV